MNKKLSKESNTKSFWIKNCFFFVKTRPNQFARMSLNLYTNQQLMSKEMKKKFTKTFDLSQIAEDPMDSYLDTLGLWKKRIARDGSCLFRAVAEQVRYLFFIYTFLTCLLIFYYRFIPAKYITIESDKSALDIWVTTKKNFQK